MKKVLFLLPLILACSCQNRTMSQLVCVQLTDRNGISETISQKDRLIQLSSNDFLSEQPYKVVKQIFSKDSEGKTPSKLTSYHDNGQIKQYLEVKNGRAFGKYLEWYQNGVLKLEANTIEGIGDLSLDAALGWMFDDTSFAYDDKGNMIARVPYKKGVIDGLCTYYDDQGKQIKSIEYVNGYMHGEYKELYPSGEIKKITNYVFGEKQGLSEFFGNETCPKYNEQYEKNRLHSGSYYDLKGSLISSVDDYNGFKVIYQDGKLRRRLEIKSGKIEGKMTCFFEDGSISNTYYIVNGEKHGEEILYYTSKKPKMRLDWYEGEIHGQINTWYSTGENESERQMYHNEKHGKSLAFYADGSIMLIEEYENENLYEGSYFKKGKKEPVSSVVRGDGIATIYDKDGILLQRVKYEKGKPVDDT